MPDGCSIYAGASPHHRTLYIYIHLFATDKQRMQTDSRTRSIFQTRSANRRRERRNPKLTKLAHNRVEFLRSLSLHERILLAALLKCVRRTGVFEIPWADVSHQHHLYSGVFADSAPLLRELEVYLTLCSLRVLYWLRRAERAM